MRNIVAVLTCATALAGMSEAQAQVHASASVDNLQFKITDLRPSDNLTPSIRWDYQSSIVNGRESDFHLTLNADGSFRSLTENACGFSCEIYDNQFDNSGSTMLFPFGSASGATDTARAAANPSTVRSESNPLDGGNTGVNAGLEGRFDLSPYTSVTLSGRLTVHVDGAVPDGAMDMSAYGSYFKATSQAVISLSGDTRVPGLSEIVEAKIDENHLGLPLSDGNSRDVSVTFTNNTGLLSTVSLVVGTGVTTIFLQPSSVQTVPEASTWAQMALGLGALACLMRGGKAANAKTSA